MLSFEGVVSCLEVAAACLIGKVTIVLEGKLDDRATV